MLPLFRLFPKIPNPQTLTLTLIPSRSPMPPRPAPPPPEVLAEYAKSSRSLCKSCGTAIAVGVLRVGLSTKDRRGWDSVKWHHIGCFSSQPLGPAVEIKGFEELKEDDQEALKKLEVESVNFCETKEEAGKATKNDDKKIVASDKFKVITEYAKSNRSTCKGCAEVITAGSPRLGLSSKDARGFDYKQWYHLACFPVGTMSLGCTEDIDGFSSLKDCDKEIVMKLESAAADKQSDKEAQTRDDNAEVKRSDGRSSKMPKINKGDDVSSEQSRDKNLEALKPSEPGKEEILEMDFSASDIKDMYKDAKLGQKWKAFKTVIFLERDDNLHDSEKIAAFDFDGCLANTSVKRTGADAWSLMYPSIPEKLQKLHNDGYKLVIFTNESNIELWKNKRQQAVDSKVGRLNNFIKTVNVPCQVFIACGLGKNKDKTVDAFRKPKTGMWRLMEKHFNSGIPIDMEQSFYVGDAAGRDNDHSDADILFAQDLGLKFHVPDEFFVTEKASES